MKREELLNMFARAAGCWKWAPNDFWKYTDEDGPGVPDMAQMVEALCVLPAPRTPATAGPAKD
ncbi:hypothetical protein AYJ54_00530 [Bradyrhizobium centrolobii]|uniref:Uncharacterized protein n=1 Tax=Bradyrhizobium centrolobii TaxID=1505087 RepID=A0A176YHP1_9BRAD|nr:hypothetical protein [Bradyrhizobium centrolobii]OAF05425.1 hypothetical protein AYJ54_00530 [Bradyrhizobium centrolobii]